MSPGFLVNPDQIQIKGFNEKIQKIGFLTVAKT